VNLRTLSFLLLTGALLGACNKDAVYRSSLPIPNNIWDMNRPLKFDAAMNDTVGKYNIFINVRNSDNYEFNNLYLFIDITNPAKVVERDTMECILADPNGKWLGKGLGDIWDNKILFKHNVRFRKQGNYEFTITQAMRVDSLPMIMDAGVSIEKSVISQAPNKN
jgi:gliding motility-associated lipoprotein GldH